MSKRLDQDREAIETPHRIETAMNEIKAKGYNPVNDGTSVFFFFKGNRVVFHAYSGWASGKGINDGRGLKRLLTQI